MLVYFARSGARHPVIPAGLGLLIGGSISNLVDRVRLGYVTDFIDFGWWPAFNLADSFIVIGVGILLAALVAADRPRPQRSPAHLDVAADAAGARADRPARGGRRAARPLPRRRISARGPRPSGPSSAVRSSTAGRGRRATASRAASASSCRPCRPSRSHADRAAAADRLAGRAPRRGRQAGRARRPSRRRARAGTLVDALAGTVAGGEPGRPGIVHRLDRDTSGLLVVARSEEAHRRLSTLVRGARARAHLSGARPRASRLAHGADRGADRPRPRRPDPRLARHRLAPRRGHALRGRRAWDGHALLAVRLETGRMHQIRVHLAAIDLPGRRRRGLRRRATPALGRQFLHAARLAFPHPFTGERIDVESPLPPDLAGVPRRARLAHVPGTMAALSDPRPGGGSRWTVAGTLPVPPRRRRCNANRNRERGLPCPLSP